MIMSVFGAWSGTTFGAEGRGNVHWDTSGPVGPRIRGYRHSSLPRLARTADDSPLIHEARPFVETRGAMTAACLVPTPQSAASSSPTTIEWTSSRGTITSVP